MSGRLVLALLLLAGCRSGGGAAIPGGGAGGAGGSGSPGAASGSEWQQHFELDPVRDVDLMFVVGNGPGMAARQEELARTLPALFEELGKGGMPDLHVGVISGDLGAGSKPLASGRCPRIGGDRGIFQADHCGLQAGSLFLSSLKNGTENNFTGAIADTVGCMVRLGEGGCDFPHPLQAARVALYESVTPQNAGFLRDDAFLVMVFLTDRDDCSAEYTSDLFTDDATFPMTAPLLRCSQVGHLCDGKSPPLAPFSTPLTSCASNERGRLIRVRDIAESIRALKKRPDAQILVAAVAGSPADHPGASYQYVAGPGGITEASLCDADPPARAGLRIQALVSQFGRNGRMIDACRADLSGPVRAIGDWIGGRLKGLCLAAPPVDADPATPGIQPRCQAALLEPTTSGFTPHALPACRDGGPRPCLGIAEDADCPASGFSVEIDRTGASTVPGTQVSLRCASAAELSPPGPAPPACPMAPCPPRKALGQACSLGATPPALNQGIYRSDAPECPSGLCLRPARDIAVARAVDTQPTCSKACATDLDCADAEVRDRSSGADKRCVGGYTCAVPFEVGPLCCRKLCVCKDFLPASGAVAPASCAASAPAPVCENRP